MGVLEGGSDMTPEGDGMVQQLENTMIHVIIDFFYTRVWGWEGAGLAEAERLTR